MQAIKISKDHTDAELLLLCRQGNELAFKAIYDKYVLRLLAIGIDKTGDRFAAEELVQNTFLSFYNNIQSTETLQSVMAFLYVILKNKILDWQRKNVRQQKFVNYFSAQTSENDHSTQALIETRELERLLQEEIEKLPEQCKKVFILRRTENYSNKEVALHLKISENTVEQHMRKAIRLLKVAFVNHTHLLLLI